ncbi:RNA-binding protein 45 [Lingula anatina]|uniref:RNA-binding protein 45 n=1 Tax=Lingula anatina TaxID=7574 RepID=A0A1S3K0R2_LINAN|nr:RNA-binding protein 45 [Lingula anatina]|eukprot:XP_013416230.1 RNA-binding protein 45 [Lingula anatina]
MARDTPANSRLFVLCAKGVTEPMLRKAFEKYGTIEDIWVVKDRQSNKEKGVAYIKFSKASEAALAMEELNGRTLPDDPKPLKVMIASKREHGSTRETNEEEKGLRIFIMVPTEYTESDIREIFGKWGDIEYVRIVRHQDTQRSKGLAYVKYYKAYHCALALENCESRFKAVFAEPKSSRDDRARRDSRGSRSYDRDLYSEGFSDMGRESRGGGGGGGFGGIGRDSRYGGPDRDFDGRFAQRDDGYDGGRRFPEPSMTSRGPLESIQSSYSPAGGVRLQIIASMQVTAQQMHALCNMVPQLEYCDFNQGTGTAYVKYASPQCAAWALDHLSNLEYPPGCPLTVRMTDGQPSESTGALASVSPTGVTPAGSNKKMDHAGMISSVMQATNLLRQAGMVVPPNLFEQLQPKVDEDGSYCSAKLPAKQPLILESTPVAKRLFIVSQPDPLPDFIITDLFSRFGNLIDAYMMRGRTCGFAKYGSEESANEAMRVLHKQEVCGMLLKVMEAEPQPEEGAPSSKRPRT